MRSKLIFLSLFLVIGVSKSFGQVGVGTTTPEGMLDVPSIENGAVLPRIALTSLSDSVTVVNPKGGAVVAGTIVYNIGTAGLAEAGYYYWSTSGTWVPMFDTDSIEVYTGEALITNGGTLTITDVPFSPKNVRFTAYPNVDQVDLNRGNAVGDNDLTVDNVFGDMRGYAQEIGGTVDQQVIFAGGSAGSPNDLSRFASPLHCIGIRYSDDNGNNIGMTSATLTGFTGNGFVLDVDSFVDSILVIYEVHRN